PPWSATASSSGHAATLVAHNIAFDHRIMAIAIVRVARTWARLPQGCTMEKTRGLCALPLTDRMIAARRLEHKAPRLAEAYEHLFDIAMPGQAIRRAVGRVGLRRDLARAGGAEATAGLAAGAVAGGRILEALKRFNPSLRRVGTCRNSRFET